MTTLSVEDALHQAVLTSINGKPVRVDKLLTSVAAAQGVDLELAAAAMWDLVDDGRLSYGVDAQIRKVKA